MVRRSLTQRGSESEQNPDMSSAPLTNWLERLDALTALLGDGAAHTLAELSQALRVSDRTLARDLRLLRDRGWLIDSTSGPGGGVCLSRDSAHSSALLLRETQAVELLLAMAASEAMGLSLSVDLAGIRAQLARVFAPADRKRIGTLRQRIRVAAPASEALRHTQRKEKPNVRSVLHAAFVRYQRANISYKALDGKLTQRRIEPHALLLSWPFWYVLAWDADRSALRTFRMDRVEQANLLDEPFRPRPLQTFWDHCDGVGMAL